MNVLVSLHKGYGLGDAVQVSAVLRHLAKHRSNWCVYYRAEEGKHQVGRGIVHDHFAYGEWRDVRYDTEVQICLYDTWANWVDRPNTRVANCLHDTFGRGWDAECGRYRVDVRREVGQEVTNAFPFLLGKRMVAVHYDGDSSQSRKNLGLGQVDVVCDEVLRLGRFPLILDWRGRSPVPNGETVGTVGHRDFSLRWGGDAEYNCAVIARCEAFVGIDSGPGKCAAATDTPSLITWTGHHPACFYDPAPNVTHLAPRGYAGCYPACPAHVEDWFEAHNSVRTYVDDPVGRIVSWLREVL